MVPGTAFLADGIGEDSANALTTALVDVAPVLEEADE